MESLDFPKVAVFRDVVVSYEIARFYCVGFNQLAEGEGQTLKSHANVMAVSAFARTDSS